MKLVPFTTRILSTKLEPRGIKKYHRSGCFVTALALICSFSKQGYAKADDVANVLFKNKRLFTENGSVCGLKFGFKKQLLTELVCGLNITRDGIRNIKQAKIIRISNNGGDTHFMLYVNDVNTGQAVFVCPSYPVAFPSMRNALRFYLKKDGRKLDQIREFPFDTDNILYNTK